MTPDILREVEAIGGRVWLESGQVKYRLPADRPDLVDRLRARKAEILAALATPTPLSAGDLVEVGRWLDTIGETDPAERARVLTKCATDPRALAQVLRHAREDAEFRPPPAPTKPRPATGLVIPFARPRQ